MYWHETWATTRCLCALIDAFDTWALCKILRIPYTRHIRNADVRSVSGLLSNMAMERRLRFFGHIAHSAPDEDHHLAVAAAIHKPPSDWKRPPGRPNCTWLRAIESDLRPLNWSFLCMEEGSLTRTLCSRRVCHEEKQRGRLCHNFSHTASWQSSVD